MSYQLKSIIYVHNMDGFDQVSEVLGIYKMKYLGTSLSDVVKEIFAFYDKSGKKDGLGSCYYNSLQWNCLMLGRTNDECLIGLNGNDVSSY